jgi:hypothetical protein
MDKLTMGAWFAQQLTREFEDGERYHVAAFILYHLSGGGMVETEILSVATGGKQYTAAELSKRFNQTATTHASGIPGRQGFVIKAEYAGENTEPAQFPFGKQGENQDIGIGTEGPTPQGIVSQMMRHAEVTMRICTLSQETMMQRQNETIEQMRDYQERLMKQNAEAFELLKERAIEDAQAEHLRQKDLLEYERKTQTQAALMQMLPGFIEKLTGKSLLPQDTTTALAVSTLKKTVTPEQMAAIAGILTPEQLMVLMPLIQPSEPAASGGGNAPSQ